MDANGHTGEEVLNPRALGLDFYEADALVGGDAEHNADVARRLFAGEVEGAVKDAVLINAAAALAAVHGWEEEGLQDTLRREIERAREALESGAAQAKLEAVLALK